MINITLSNSLKKIIEQTLNESAQELMNKDSVIISKSNKLNFKISFTPNFEIRTLPIKLTELKNLKSEVKKLLPETLYVFDLKFI